MESTLKRGELDALAQAYSLNPAATEAMLDLAGVRPTRAAGLEFISRCLRYGGVLSLAAALVFFVAANWSKFAVFGRFALLEIVLVALVVLALFKPPPRFVGRGALFLAFITTGALLALFGQTYQTGADVYELFLTWALLGLPLAIVGQWGVTSAAWVLVLNTALLLFCGWNPHGGVLWVVFDGNRFTASDAILAAGVLNLLLWFGFEKLSLRAVPDWVRRLILSCAFVFLTWAGVLGVIEDHDFGGEHIVLAIIVPTLAILAVGAYALRQRGDIYPLAVVMSSFVVVVMCWIPQASGSDETTFFMMALWLIGASTVGGRVLTLLMRQWRAERAA